MRILAGYRGEAGTGLCDWQRDQRVRRKADRMPADQERLLTEAGFCWDPAAEAWHARYQEAAAWNQEHGSLDFPRKHPLETWLRRQQKLHEASRLPADRAALLQELGALTSPPPESTREPR